MMLTKCSFILRVRPRAGFHRHHATEGLAKVKSAIYPQMSTEVRNRDFVAKAMEAANATSSQMYIRAKALAEGKLDSTSISFPGAQNSISIIAG